MNGPAFPTRSKDRDGFEYTVPGMTLRDYFAAKAMQGIVADGPEESWSWIAKRAYAAADAMLAAREGGAE